MCVLPRRALSTCICGLIPGGFPAVLPWLVARQGEDPGCPHTQFATEGGLQGGPGWGQLLARSGPLGTVLGMEATARSRCGVRRGRFAEKHLCDADLKPAFMEGCSEGACNRICSLAKFNAKDKTEQRQEAVFSQKAPVPVPGPHGDLGRRPRPCWAPLGNGMGTLHPRPLPDPVCLPCVQGRPAGTHAPGLNAVARRVEGVAHHVGVGAVQLPEHLQQEPATCEILPYTRLLPHVGLVALTKQGEQAERPGARRCPHSRSGSHCL